MIAHLAMDRAVWPNESSVMCQCHCVSLSLYGDT